MGLVGPIGSRFRGLGIFREVREKVNITLILALVFFISNPFVAFNQSENNLIESEEGLPIIGAQLREYVVKNYNWETNLNRLKLFT